MREKGFLPLPGPPNACLRLSLLAQDWGASGDPAGHDPEVTGRRAPGRERVGLTQVSLGGSVCVGENSGSGTAQLGSRAVWSN